jgi:hypothetical protein
VACGLVPWTCTRCACVQAVRQGILQLHRGVVAGLLRAVTRPHQWTPGAPTACLSTSAARTRHQYRLDGIVVNFLYVHRRTRRLTEWWRRRRQRRMCHRTAWRRLLRRWRRRSSPRMGWRWVSISTTESSLVRTPPTFFFPRLSEERSCCVLKYTPTHADGPCKHDRRGQYARSRPLVRLGTRR